MISKDILGDLTNAQHASSVLQRRGRGLQLDVLATRNKAKPGALVRRAAVPDVLSVNDQSMESDPQQKPSVAERRGQKLTMLSLEDEVDVEVYSPAKFLEGFNQQVSGYVEYYKDFKPENPRNSFNMLPGDQGRYDPIHWAAINNDVNSLKSFLSSDINKLDQRGRNALYFASACGYVDSIKYLLENHDAKAQLEVLYNDLRHGYQMLIPEILRLEGIKDIKGVKDFISSYQEYNRCPSV